MRQFFSVLLLIWLSFLVSTFTGIGSAFTSIGLIVKTIYLRCAARHDIKYALTLEEKAQMLVHDATEDTATERHEGWN